MHCDLPLVSRSDDNRGHDRLNLQDNTAGDICFVEDYNNADLVPFHLQYMHINICVHALSWTTAPYKSTSDNLLTFVYSIGTVFKQEKCISEPS